jgi:hypothetical protein
MSIIPPISPPGAAADVICPSSDGRPVAETPLHRDVLLYSIDIMRDYFAANRANDSAAAGAPRGSFDRPLDATGEQVVFLLAAQ